MPIIENRIEKAGIRLAGLLDKTFDKTPMNGQVIVETHDTQKSASITGAAQLIDIADAAKHLNERMSVTAKIYGHRDFGSMVLVNLGAAYPDSPLMAVLRGDAKSLGSQLDDKTITVTGQVADYKGKPEIVVTDTTSLVIQ